MPSMTTFVLDPLAEPPFAKCRKLASSHLKFRKSLDGTADESPAERDMSLASITAVEGWPDQEIVNLLVAHRRDKGADPIGEDYYARIIVQARAPITQAAAQERFEANVGEDRATKLADLNPMLGLGPDDPQILDLVKFAGDPPEFWMETSGGSITLRRSENIFIQRRFRNAVAANTGRVLATSKVAEWGRRLEAIYACCRVVELGDASHPAVEMAQWLEDYLDSQTILDDQNVAAEQGLPFRKDGAVLFTLSGFRQYLRFGMGEHLSSHKLGQRLRLCGVTSTHVNIDLKKGGDPPAITGFI